MWMFVAGAVAGLAQAAFEVIYSPIPSRYCLAYYLCIFVLLLPTLCFHFSAIGMLGDVHTICWGSGKRYTRYCTDITFGCNYTY